MNSRFAYTLLLVAALGPPAWGQTDMVARVNGITIRMQDLAQHLDGLRSKTPSASGTNRIAAERLQQRALANLIDEQLLWQAAEKKGLDVSRSELVAARDEIARGLPPGLTVDESALRAGSTPEELNWKLREGILLRKLLLAETPVVNVAPEQARQIFDANPGAFDLPDRATFRHIFFNSPGSNRTEDATANRIAEVMRRLADGEEFQTICRAYSDDASGRSRGGLYENLSRGTIQKIINEAVFSSPTGKVVGPITTPAGVHLIRVEERFPPEKATFESAEQRIRLLVSQEIRRTQMLRYVARLRAQARIEFAPGNEIALTTVGAP